MEFRLGKHTMTGEDMVEVFRDGEFVAAIYEHKEGLNIVSKHLDGVQHESTEPPSVVVKFTQ